MAAYVQQAQEQFDQMVTRPGPVNDGLSFLEEKTKVKKQYIAYGTPSDSPRFLRYSPIFPCDDPDL